MPVAPTRWIKRTAEFRPKDEVELVPEATRGIYVLYRYHVWKKTKPAKRCYAVAYVGLSTTSVLGRLRAHRRSPQKSKLWSHFSVFEVWDNVLEAEITELEGMFRHIYRYDVRANRLNKQKVFSPLKAVSRDELAEWRQA